MTPGKEYIGISTPFYCHDGQGHLLMHKRSEQCRDEHHRWDTGSGKLEFGISLRDNVLKEIREEYGCEGEIQEQLPAHDIFRTLDGVDTHWVVVPFVVKVDRGSVINGEPHKIEEMGWFDIDHLPEPLHTGFAYSFERYKSYFQKYLTVSE